MSLPSSPISMIALRVQGCACFPEIFTFFTWTQRNLEFILHRKWSLNRQSQCKSKKNYRAQTPQNLTLIKIFQKFRKTSTLQQKVPILLICPQRDELLHISTNVYTIQEGTKGSVLWFFFKKKMLSNSLIDILMPTLRFHIFAVFFSVWFWRY